MPLTPRWFPEADSETAAREAEQLFVTTFGRAPSGVWAAPGRINLIGEHVDYAGGLVLPMALQHMTFVALAEREDKAIDCVSGIDPTHWRSTGEQIVPGAVHGWGGYVAGVPWALGLSGGFEAAVLGRVPNGAGLSSSAALGCATAIGFDQLAGLGLGDSDAGRAVLAAACVRAENEIAGAPTGGMDQAAALRCRAGHALLLDCRDFSAGQLPFDAAAARLAVLVIDTTVHHALVDGQYGDRRAACERAAALLGLPLLGDLPIADLDVALKHLEQQGDGPVLARRARHVVTEIDRVRASAELLRAGRLAELGPLLDASHASLREDYEVSCTELDVACAAARQAGALGARMVGGGFGGSAIALVPADRAEAVAHAVAKAFATNGFHPANFMVTSPGEGARRVH